MSIKLKDTDHGFKKLLADAKALSKGGGVSVGVHAAEGAASHGDAESVLDVAACNEFGLGVPERSFLRAWFDQNRDANLETLRKAVKIALRGEKTLPEAFELLGLKFTGEVQRAIAQNTIGLAPNAQSTIDAKGSDKPLINTGQLRQAITYMVRDKPTT